LDLLDAQMAQLKDEDALCGKLFQQRSLRCSAVQVACWGMASTSSSTAESVNPEALTRTMEPRVI